MRFAARASVVTVACLLPVIAALPAAADPLAFTPAEKSAVESIVREYLRDNPEVLVEAIQALRAKQEQGRRDRARAALVEHRGLLSEDRDSPFVGNPSGDVTVVEFFDYRCPYCKKVLPSIRRLLAEDGNVRYVFKEFPILGPESVVAARAALAAWNIAPAAYMEFHSAMMSARGALTEDRVMRLAAANGLDPTRLRKAMSEPRVEAALKVTAELANALGISGTPAFVVGDEVIPGAIDLTNLKRLIAKARQS